MNPLCCACGLRIWKIKSCFRIPVAPATLRSLPIWVSLWMLMSFRSLMFRVGRAGAGAGGAGGGGGTVLSGSGARAVRLEPVGMAEGLTCEGYWEVRQEAYND